MYITMQSPGLKKESIIKDIRIMFRLEKLKIETIDITIKGLRNICLDLKYKMKKFKIK